MLSIYSYTTPFSVHQARNSVNLLLLLYGVTRSPNSIQGRSFRFRLVDKTHRALAPISHFTAAAFINLGLTRLAGLEADVKGGGFVRLCKAVLGFFGYFNLKLR